MSEQRDDSRPVLIIAEEVSPVVASRDDGTWVAGFPELGLTAEGPTEAEARTAIGRLYLSVKDEPWLKERWEQAARMDLPNWSTHVVSEERFTQFWEEAARTGELPEL